MSVSRESKERSRKGMPSARYGPLLLHNPHSLHGHVGGLYSSRLDSTNRTNRTLSCKRCFSSSLAKSCKRRFT